jgi:hypothetical protein
LLADLALRLDGPVDTRRSQPVEFVAIISIGKKFDHAPRDHRSDVLDLLHRLEIRRDQRVEIAK